MRKSGSGERFFFPWERGCVKAGPVRKSWLIYLLLGISLVFYLAAEIAPIGTAGSLRKEMVRAAELMAQAETVIKDCRISRGIAIDGTRDINKTGLIGVELSSTTTSIGQLEAKRTTTNPNFAGLLVLLLSEAGVGTGDTLAVGASGSFPALIVAVLAAAKVMNLKPLVISSLGASQWGANVPEFTWLDIWRCLAENRVFFPGPIALSLGGERDTGEDMSAAGRKKILAKIRASGLPFIDEPDLPRNVALRMRLYKQAAASHPIKAFINIGGAWANLGTDARILAVKPGLTSITNFPPEDNRGMIMAMAALNVPVIHCLFIKGIVRKYGLEWDPSPLPRPGKGGLYSLVRARSRPFLLITAAYFFCILALMFIGIFKKR